METRGLADLSPRGGVNPRTRRAGWWMALLWAAMLGLLALAIRQAPLASIGAALAHLSAGQVALLLVINAVILLLMTGRWAILLRALGARVPLGRLLVYRLAGFGVSYFTPGPQFGGEPLQVDLLTRREGVALHTAISSVMLERLIDLLANLTFLALGVVTVLVSGVLGQMGGAAWYLAPALLLFPLGHLAALWLGRRPATWLVERAAKYIQHPVLRRAVELTGQSEAQIAVLCRENPRALLSVIALAGLTWAAVIFEFWLTLRFLGVEANLTQIVSALTALRLAFLLPLPGALGALEASQALAASLLGWDPAVGLALSLVIRARDVFLASLGVWLGGYAYRRFFFGRGFQLSEGDK